MQEIDPRASSPALDYLRHPQRQDAALHDAAPAPFNDGGNMAYKLQPPAGGLGL